MKKYSFYLLGILLATFGLLTLYLSGSVIFDLFEMRAKQGDFVMPVIWANFVASLLYLVAAFGFFKQRKWTSKILIFAVAVLIIGAVGLYLHIDSGGVYMQKTIKAIGLRMGVTLVFLAFSYFKITKKKKDIITN
ncbi:MAG TPA: hypothetical protein EYG92_10865 [Lutibacter sp.]|nr:hypothetical protein [Lutibacter sp.]